MESVEMNGVEPGTGPRRDERRLEEIDPRLAAAVAAARAAGEVAARYFRAGVEVEWKESATGRSPVTIADREAEQAARSLLASRFPDHGFLGEEMGESGSRSTRWILDPIDGTANFILQIPLFGALVALEEEGRITAAAAYNPVLGEMAWALRGGGAFLGGEPMQVSRRATLDEALVVNSSVGEFLRQGFGRAGVAGERAGAAGGQAGVDGERAGVDGLLAAARRDRGYGDYFGYLLVASGRAEVMLDALASPWDLAAPKLLVEEAGGRLTALDGSDSIYGGGAVATNGLLHETVLGFLNPS
jgi:histidinol phosphatase-like enzyme (inositol monophosphatase family)